MQQRGKEEEGRGEQLLSRRRRRRPHPSAARAVSISYVYVRTVGIPTYCLYAAAAGGGALCHLSALARSLARSLALL